MWYDLKHNQQKMRKARANINVYSSTRCSGSSLILSCLTVSFSCGIVYSRVKRTPVSEKKADVGISHQTENQKENVGIRTRYVYIPFVLLIALEGGVNSNPSSRERLFLRTANPRQDPNSYVHGWHEACCRTQETRPGAWSSSVQTDARAWANHILPKPSIRFRTG